MHEHRSSAISPFAVFQLQCDRQAPFTLHGIHPHAGNESQDREKRKRKHKSKAGQAGKAGKAGKTSKPIPVHQQPNVDKSTKVKRRRKSHTAASATAGKSHRRPRIAAVQDPSFDESGEDTDPNQESRFSISRILDAAYMFSPRVKCEGGIFPPNKRQTIRTDDDGVEMAYTLHAKVEWERTDIHQGPFEPSLEVADADLLNSGNFAGKWAQLAKEKCAALGLRTWPIKDIPYDKNPKLGRLAL
jgi:hypothetical protein